MDNNKMMKKDPDHVIETIAENYVTLTYAPVGERVYFWEEWLDTEDDTSAVTQSSFAPPDDTNYSWSEVTYNLISSSFISERDEKEGDYIVEVNALIAVSTGTQDDDDPEEVEPESRTIYVHISRDHEGCLYAHDAEEQ